MTSNEKPKFVLFFANDCRYSNSFLKKLRERHELFKLFKLVDINQLPSIPDEVDEVPCVYDGNQVYMGTNAFKWLDERSIEFLSAADDGLPYSFLDGQNEQVFNNFSLLEQKNGSYGIGGNNNSNDPTRPMQPTLENKNQTLDQLVAARSRDYK